MREARRRRMLAGVDELEFARRSQRALGDTLTVVDPVDFSLLRGVSFYDLFIDRRRWPEIMRRGYGAMTAAQALPFGGCPGTSLRRVAIFGSRADHSH